MNVADVQGFRASNNEFILKEICVMYDRDITFNEVFLPPCGWHELSNEALKTNNYCRRFVHGLMWDRGTIPYCDIVDVLTQVFNGHDFVYVKGSEKATFLSRYVHMVDLDDKIGLRLSQMEYDGDHSSLALVNCNKIVNWLNKN